MAENVFIIGAGFSSESGSPLVGDFLQEAKYIFDYRTQELGPFLPYFNLVFLELHKMKQINTVFQEDLDNIEKLYSLVDFQCHYTQTNTPLYNLRRGLILLIIKTLELKINLNAIGEIPTDFKYLRDIKRDKGLNAAPVPDMYELFALILLGKRFDDQFSSSIISFNYDIIIESILNGDLVNHNYSYFLPGKVHIRSNMKLLKLHGSANWMTCLSPKCQEKPYVEIKSEGKYLDILLTGKCEKCDQRTLAPLIVPPSWDKTQFRDLLKPIWNEACRELQEAKRIFILGYSFPETDLYFKSLLQTAIPDNKHSPKIVIVNNTPNDSSDFDRFRRLFNPQYYSNNVIDSWSDLTVSEFVSRILQKRPLRDICRR